MGRNPGRVGRVSLNLNLDPTSDVAPAPVTEEQLAMGSKADLEPLEISTFARAETSPARAQRSTHALPSPATDPPSPVLGQAGARERSQGRAEDASAPEARPLVEMRNLDLNPLLSRPGSDAAMAMNRHRRNSRFQSSSPRRWVPRFQLDV